jgi:hypothetical protein
MARLLFGQFDCGKWLLVGASMLALPVGALGQISDTTPPVLTKLSFPASVDVTKGPQNFAVTIHATDDLSGVNYAYVALASPSGKQNQYAYVYVRSSGTPLAAVLIATLTIPQYGESGKWTVQALDLWDNAGNEAIYSTNTLAAKGFTTTFSVVSNPDTTPPTLTGVSISPGSLNVSSSSETVTVQLDITDNESGVSFACGTYCYNSVILRSPSGIQYQEGLDYYVTQVSGTALNGVWKSEITIPRYAEAGVWSIDYLYLYDKAGNTEYIYGSDLKNKGFASTFTVSSRPDDVTPPVVNGITLPGLVDTSGSPQTVQGTLNVSDNLAGFNYANIYFYSPSNGQDHYADAAILTSGTPLNGNYSFQFRMPQYSEAGTWTIQYLDLVDLAGNVAYLNASDLINLGLNVSFDVIKGTTSIDGTISSTTGGTVNDQTFGNRASISVPPGILTQNTDVSIDVLQSSASPVIPTPQGYSGEGTLFMNLTLTPTPTEPFPAPGISVTIPVQEGSAKPGSHMDLYRIDTVTGHLIPELSVSGGIISGVVAADGLSATFTGLASLSTVIGLIPNGYPIGDANKDGVVNCADVAIVKAAFGTSKGGKGFNAEADLNNDGVVDINDLALVLHHLASGLVCQ